MAEQPFEYPKRNLTTKDLVKRIDLFYFKKPNSFRDLRRKLTWGLPLFAVLAALPFVFGVGGGEKAFSNGPVSKPHQVFEQNCQACHVAAFSHVRDDACLTCHDGPAHVTVVSDAYSASQPDCATCHLEHEGNEALAFVGDALCTNCHGDLTRVAAESASNSRSISDFVPGGHPDFPDPAHTDNRPLKLNHAVHMPPEGRKIRDIELPMACSDCHQTDAASPTGDLLPVTFDEHCLSCHKRELEFDVFGVLSDPQPAPHTRNVAEIRAIMREAYAAEAARNPAIVERPLGRSLDREPSLAPWLERVQTASEEFLFNRKCVYCHELGPSGPLGPTVRETAPIIGRFGSDQERSEPWLEDATFSHHAHRAVTCSSCHTEAATSGQTSEILIPHLADCVDCHGSSGSLRDTCAQCHVYHDRSLGIERDRLPIDALIGKLEGGYGVANSAVSN